MRWQEKTNEKESHISSPCCSGFSSVADLCSMGGIGNCGRSADRLLVE